MHFFGSVSLSLVARAIGVINVILIIPIVVNNYSTEEFALFSILTQSITIYGFLDLGIGGILINEIIRLRNKGYVKILRTVVFQALKFVSIVAISLIIVVTILYYIFGVQFLDKEFSESILIILDNNFVKLSVLFFLVLPTTLIQKIQFGFLDNIIFHITEIAQKSLQILAIYVLVYNGNNIIDLVIYFYLIILIVNILNISIYFFWIKKAIFKNTVLVKRNYMPSLIKKAFYFFLGSIFFFLSRTLDTYLIGFFGSFGELKDFEIIKRPFDIGLTTIMVVTSVLWPILGEAHQKKEFSKVKRILNTTIICVILTMLLLLVLMVIFGNPILQIWISDDIYFEKKIFILVGIVFLLYGLGNILITHLNSINVFSVQLVIFVLLALIGIPTKIYYLQENGLEGYLQVLIVLLLSIYIVPIYIISNCRIKKHQI